MGAMIGTCRTAAAVMKWEVACWRNGWHMQDYRCWHRMGGGLLAQ